MRIVIQIFRIIVGGLFIFSGLIKANDPIGFGLKLDEYWEVFGIHWLSPLSLSLSVLVCAVEIILGVMLLLGARIKLTLILLILMITFFAALNFYSGYFDKVKECGCFGDAIKMTPWEEFRNNIAMLVMTIIMLIKKNEINPLFGIRFENILVSLGIIGAFAFPLYTINYLPIIDFRPYAIGKNLAEQMKGVPDELQYYYKLKNKKSGETKEFTAWPENWDKEWDYVDSRTEVTKKGVEPPIKDFSISDLNGSNYTQDIISNPNYNFFLIVYSLDEANKGVQGRINDFYALCKKDSVPFICLTASGTEDINSFKSAYGAMYDFYNTDGRVLETMIRSNPGLMLMKNGVVIDMWHYHSFPSYNDVKVKYLAK